MLNVQTIKNLKANWPFGEDLFHTVEARIFDPASCAEWYLLACDPENPDRVAAIVCLDQPVIEFVSIADLSQVLNAEGEHLQVDPNFRREKGIVIWAKVNRKRQGTYGL